MSLIVQDAESMLRAFQVGEEVAVERLDQFMRQIRLVAQGLGADELRALIALTARLEAAVEQHRDDLARQIRRTGSSRRALKGYRHLRSHRTAQRVNCKS